MHLVEGPLKRSRRRVHVHARSASEGCKIALALDFEYSGLARRRRACGSVSRASPVAWSTISAAPPQGLWLRRSTSKSLTRSPRGSSCDGSRSLPGRRSPMRSRRPASKPSSASTRRRLRPASGRNRRRAMTPLRDGDRVELYRPLDGRSEGSAPPPREPLASALTLLLLLLSSSSSGRLSSGYWRLYLLGVLDQLVRIFRKVVAVDLDQRVVLEVERQVLVVHDVAAAADRRDVVPAILVERAHDRRRAHHEQHLALGHAGLERIDGRLVEEVALLHVDLVDRGRSRPAESKTRRASQRRRMRETTGKFGKARMIH